MSRLFEIEPDPPKPRQKPRKLMHVYDAGPAEDGQCMVVFQCERCQYKTEWMLAKNVSEAKRGIPCLTCNGWQTIESAPKDGTIVELASQEHPGMLPQAMAWDGVRWAGMVFMPLGSKETWWDESDPPTHWRSIEA